MVGGCERSHATLGSQLEGRGKGERPPDSTLEASLRSAKGPWVIADEDDNGCSLDSVIESLPVILTRLSTEDPLGTFSYLRMRSAYYRDSSLLARMQSVWGRVFLT